MTYEKAKNHRIKHHEENIYYKNLLIELIETLNENQRRNLYYIGLGMKKNINRLENKK
ncbi:hypothetical protein [Lachnotalea glycerini]|uniref:hypothetical protein n=1 Tax=Lachnotalea glycerini TaxID=1763509 RepID=UPI0015F28DBF|nr:hypothetical protein [Lachnotalea glycerini]